MRSASQLAKATGAPNALNAIRPAGVDQTNKEERPSAEAGEKRARAKENIVQPNTNPTLRGETECARD
jgi:hypothetical protein